MKLELANPYLSLLPFQAELPKFTLITGLNGSGKSQLLAGISNGPVANSIADRSQIRLFGPHGFKLGISRAESYPGYDYAVNLADFLDRTGILFAAVRQKWLDWGQSNNLDYDTLVNLTKRLHASRWSSEKKDYFLNNKSYELSALDDFIKKLRVTSDSIGLAQHDSEINTESIIRGAEARWNLPYFLLSSSQLREASALNQSLFEVSLGAVFTKYRDDNLRNKLNRIAHDAGNGELPPLSEEDFLNEKGPPPWSLINSLLSELNVDARFQAPPNNLTRFYDPVMVDSVGNRFSPSQLSSGEEVILALAALGYAAVDGRRLWTAPSLVLLDEVDAPLHPAMAKTFLKVINEVLIGQFAMHVIATSHSPSTIAQSDLDDVFVMKKNEPGLARITRDRAITILTEGVPTLSVSISSRRQVFAESPVEAANLDRLYQILKPSLNSEFSLQFIATGSKQTNSSKSDVERIVGDLVSAGNTSVYGVIDWDTTNISTNRIKVIAAGRRYALENIILDPLVLATYLYKTLDKKALSHHGMDTSIDVFSLRSLEQVHWQSLAERVTTRVLGAPPHSVIECKYHGGMTINIDQAYLEHDAHKLEDKIVASYKMLENIKRAGSGRLTGHLIDHVLSDLPSLIPIEVEEVFIDLLATI